MCSGREFGHFASQRGLHTHVEQGQTALQDGKYGDESECLDAKVLYEYRNEHKAHDGHVCLAEVICDDICLDAHPMGS